MWKTLRVAVTWLMVLCGSVRAQNAQDDLPPPREPGKILGFDLAPGGPPLVETLPSSGMTLADLEGLAMGNHPALVQANARVEAARGRWVQGGLLPNPNVGYAANQIGDRGTAGQQGAYVQQLLPLGGKLRLNRAVAEQEIQQAMRDREAWRWMVLNDVRIAFYDALIAQESVNLTARLLRIGEEGERSANELLRAGQASRVDLLQARIEARAARIESTNARNRLAAAWRRLAAVIAVPQLQPAELLGDVDCDMPEYVWEEALFSILAASPELAAARAGASRARLAVERARVEPVPDLDTQYYPQHDFASGDNVHSVLTTINIPLFDRNQGAIRSAQADLVEATREVARLELGLQFRLGEVFERYANARQQSRTYKQEIIPDAKASLELVSNGYRQGEFTYLTLLTAQRTFFQTNLAYLDALLELRRAEVQIEGYLLTGSLGQAEGSGASNQATREVPGMAPLGGIR
jgi:cobalt-zinc-cadmium efflux system outer membrane protein